MSSVAAARGGFRAPWAWLLGVGLLAFGVRLVAVLGGAGLFGRIGYDGSVYYASAAALAHGALPYRDFLLLHPPGITLALLPFAALGPVLGDADAYALARLAWFGLGGVSAALVLHLLRPRGLGPALAGAVFYAVFLPAVTSERTTSLEAVGSVCLLGALALLAAGRDSPPAAASVDRSVASSPTAGVWRPLAAGALLGLATGTKIWGAALVVVLVAWTAWRHRGDSGVRRAGLLLAGAVGTTTLVCLPFFLAAPGAMWRMVVLDQLGRPRVSAPLGSRLLDVAGMTGLHGLAPYLALVGAAVVLLVALVVLARRDPLGRLAAALLLVSGAVLVLSPPWSVAYTALSAPPLALLVGCGVTRLAQVRGRAGRVLAAGAAIAAVVGAAASLPAVDAGSRFPGRSMERVFAAVPGCVTTDDPIALIETGALQRDLDRGCPVVVDLSGYSWDLQPSARRGLSRAHNAQWQRLALAHLAGGDASVVVRFRTLAGLSASTRATIDRWPLLGAAGPYDVRRPAPTGAGTPG